MLSLTLNYSAKTVYGLSSWFVSLSENNGWRAFWVVARVSPNVAGKNALGLYGIVGYFTQPG